MTIGSEILGATSFARGGSASASMIELLGEAGVVAQSINATYVIAYRSIDVEAAAVPSTATSVIRRSLSGVGAAAADASGSFLVKRAAVPVLQASSANGSGSITERLAFSATTSATVDPLARVVLYKPMRSMSEVTAVCSSTMYRYRYLSAEDVTAYATVSSDALLRQRAMAPVALDGTAIISTATMYKYAALAGGGVVPASVESSATSMAFRPVTATIDSLATGDASNVVHVTVDISGEAAADYDSVFTVNLMALPVNVPLIVDSSASYVRRIPFVTDATPESAFTSAFIVEVSNSPTPGDRVMVVPEESRRMESTAMTYLGTYKKQPAETLDYEIDFSTFLPAGDDIDAVNDPPVILIEPAGLTQVGLALVTGQNVKLWFSGGTDGTTYKVTVTVTTEQGRVKQNEFKVKLKDI